nr:immunoglobulin light chain junction region [Macaca mulatta]MPO02744.1 immunoglobulin light chain junction region [Macaca mulatta]
CQHSYGTPYRF